MWFEELFGFREVDYSTTKAILEFRPPYLRSLVNESQKLKIGFIKELT